MQQQTCWPQDNKFWSPHVKDTNTALYIFRLLDCLRVLVMMVLCLLQHLGNTNNVAEVSEVEEISRLLELLLH
jgi:hypothetical protein